MFARVLPPECRHNRISDGEVHDKKPGREEGKLSSKGPTLGRDCWAFSRHSSPFFVLHVVVPPIPQRIDAPSDTPCRDITIKDLMNGNISFASSLVSALLIR